MNFVYRARSRVLTALFTVCATWLVTISVIWLTTGRTVPLIKVRWVSDITNESRSTTERDLSLVLHEPRPPDTASYFLTDAHPPNVERIVLHPLVEDTAGLNRGTFALENPQYVRMWIGDRHTVMVNDREMRSSWLLLPNLMYLSVFGCLYSGTILGLGVIRRHFPVELARVANAASRFFGDSGN